MSTGSRLGDLFAEAMKKEKLEDSNEEFDVMYQTGFLALDYLNGTMIHVKSDKIDMQYRSVGIADGSSNMFIGRSGCGKSTLVTQIIGKIAKQFEDCHIFYDDIEKSLPMSRKEFTLGLNQEELAKKVHFRDKGITSENVYKRIQAIRDIKVQNKADYMYDTGLYDTYGNKIVKMVPTIYFIDSFANSDASVGLVLGSFAALIVTIAIYIIRGVTSFKATMLCIPDGFKAMVPAILILALAWTLKGMTDALDAKQFVADFISGSAPALQNFLPAIIFIIAGFLAFATGTSWGTFGILIPICIAVFPAGDNPLRIISISACMAGAVCGDHISPISDTTIMASAGAQCDHVNHVSTQLPYALSCAAISFVTYIFAGFVQNAALSLILGAALMIGFLFAVKKLKSAKAA